MKLTIEHKMQTEIDIEFPYFTTTGIHSFCFIDEHKCIQVTLGQYTAPSIDTHSYYPQSWLLEQKCTQKEFQKHYENAQSELTIKYHELFSKNHILEP